MRLGRTFGKLLPMPTRCSQRQEGARAAVLARGFNSDHLDRSGLVRPCARPRVHPFAFKAQILFLLPFPLLQYPPRCFPHPCRLCVFAGPGFLSLFLSVLVTPAEGKQFLRLSAFGLYSGFICFSLCALSFANFPFCALSWPSPTCILVSTSLLLFFFGPKPCLGIGDPVDPPASAA